ncbi:acetate CoA-transferase subunit alpha [Snodgrassella communis]|uniref:Acetyl-CoA:acetoacetyl-CoA transferase, alpha subunit n=1 Tax=Snodgrassella communis TaxID=2946699 RepID=A0A066TFK2_9NEIS|nr:acetate CoA-transferase subunit alpha [Snodgrassella communis]KDN11501.1 Acetyl-CoA:acetoacetyl-CoA transferase, alpha subunit [Snodgrassella communis]KDN13896.1 Acetyl-CoA:acetoacetyl-CoA transferase, alpha subunit [Snodgrassella communis]PIT11208.1 acetate CoA-transferase subunit alpha [Snodgrassella communis]PIT27504.1 acetate CoA-transferase subunit alpha [Snodgrassella communis]PIT30441.1 acetate CoA-transferase subunit alpha [Snodgrassella communis]
MQKKLITTDKIGGFLKDGMTIMYGGFMGCGTPSKIVNAILESGIKDITLIGNDTAFVDTGVGPLISNNQVKKVITSHIGTNRETGRKMIAGEIEVELVPQGTLAERIRCGGAGLGGVLTPTGVGTIVAESKEILSVNGREYLLELPLRADLAIMHAHQADYNGNLVYQYAARNFNPLIATAADTVIAQVDELVEIGQIHPDTVMTPAALVDFMVSTND